MSRPVRIDRFTIVLLATVIAILATTEAFTAAKFDHVSQVQRRETAQRNVLLTVIDSPGRGPDHVAVLGNSLLLEGANIPLMTDKLGARLKPVPYFVLATNYYDWLFGLKRLFAEGIRPRYVLLGLSPMQLASPRTRGDYSARYLFQGRDLVAVARQTHMDPTTATGFILSHFSEYYSTRDVIRGYLMLRLLPSVAELRQRIGAARAPDMDAPSLRELALERLSALDQLCRENHSRFALVVPPSYQHGEEIIAQAGTERQVTVLVPVAAGEFDASYFNEDGFHLNAKGAQVFTDRLSDNIINDLAR